MYSSAGEDAVVAGLMVRPARSARAARPGPAVEPAGELALLLRVAESSADALPRAFGSFEGRGPAGGGEPFAVAARCAVGLLEGGAR